MIRNSRSRNRYFEILIEFNIADPNFQLTSEKTILKKIMEKNIFPDQSCIEKSFQNFECLDRSRSVKLKTIYVKLLLHSATNFPYWKILCETTVLITKRKIFKSLTNKLNLKKHPLKVQIIECETLDLFQEKLKDLSTKNRFFIENSRWFPGYFNQDILLTTNLINTKKEVKQFLQESQLINFISTKP